MPPEVGHLFLLLNDKPVWATDSPGDSHCQKRAAFQARAGDGHFIVGEIFTFQFLPVICPFTHLLFLDPLDYLRVS